MADIEDQTEKLEELIEMYERMTRTGESGIDAQVKLWLETSRTGKHVKDFGGSVSSVAKGLKDSTKAVAGSTGNFNDLTGVVTGVIGAMAGMLSSIPVIGGIIDGLGDAAQELATFAIEQTQTGFDSFQALSKAGQVGADGVTGLANTIKEAGIPIQTYTKLLQTNSENLAYFGGSARGGADTFNAIMKDMKEGDDNRLRNLGYSLEEIGDTVVNFQKTHQRMGILQTMSTDQLLDASVSYGKELDLIAKLTGQQREAVQKNRETMLSDTRFRAWMNQQTTDEGKKRAQAAGDLVMDLKRIAPQMATGIKDLFASGGIPVTEAGIHLVQQGMGPVIAKIRTGMMDGSLDMASARKELFKAALENRDKFRDLSAILGDFGVGIPYEEMADMAKAVGMTDEQIKEMGKTQADQVKGTDEATTSLINGIKDVQEASAIMTGLFMATDLGTTSLELFAGTINKTAKLIDKAFNPSRSANDDDYFDDDDNFGISDDDDDGKKSMSWWADLSRKKKDKGTPIAKPDSPETQKAKDTYIGLVTQRADLKRKEKLNAEEADRLLKLDNKIKLANLDIRTARAKDLKQPTAGKVTESAKAVIAADPVTESAKSAIAATRAIPDLKAAVAQKEKELQSTRINDAVGGTSPTELANQDKLAVQLERMNKRLDSLNTIAKEQRDIQKKTLSTAKAG